MPWAAKPVHLEPVIHNEESLSSEQPTLTPTRESLHTATKTHKYNNINNFYKNELSKLIKSGSKLDFHGLE